MSRILIGVSFCLLAWIAKSLDDKVTMLAAVLMAPVVVLHLVNEFVLKRNVDVYPTALALAALVGVLFGVAVVGRYKVAWAAIWIAWGLCGLLEARLCYEAKIAPWDQGDPPAAAWKAADAVLIVQNLLLLAVALFMFLQARPAKQPSAPNLAVPRSRPR